MTRSETLEGRAIFHVGHDALVMLMVASRTTSMTAPREPRLIVCSQIEVKEIAFKEELKLMLLVGCLFRVLGVYLQVVGDPFDLSDGYHRNGHQRTIATIQRVAPAPEIPQSSVCDLDPPRHEGGVDACLVLSNLTLEADFFSRIKEVQCFILWRENDLFFDSWSPIHALLTTMSCLGYDI